MSTDNHLRSAYDAAMNDDLDNIQYSQIRNYNYAQWFQNVECNGRVLSGRDRQDFIADLNFAIDQYSEGLPLLRDALKEHKEQVGETHRFLETIYSVSLFVVITMTDILVVSKYFMLAEKDYERRLMRGKLSIILNEGFKKLYGFVKTPKSEWGRLSPLMKYYPEEIKDQYQQLTSLLEEQGSSSSWWKKERDCETHQDAEELYESRQEDVIESKVMMDSMKLFDALLAVDHFLTNMHGCWLNYLLDKYKKGELKEE